RFLVSLAEQLFAGVDPLLDAWRFHLGFGQGPEPQRTPCIHDTSQTLIGPVRVGEFRLDLRTSHRRPRSRFLEAPHTDGPPRLCLGDAQSLQPDLPELVNLLRESDEPTYLPVRLGIAELGAHGLAPCLERGHCLRGKLLPF